MKWYYAKDGGQNGPVEAEELLAKLASGEVAGTDLVWREGMKDWAPAGEVTELSSYSRPEPPPTPGGMQVPAPPVQPAVGSSPYQAPQAAELAEPGVAGPIPNYLWQSIVATIFCCWPFGIPAIVFAAKVDGLVARGRPAEAREASNKAKMWCWVAFGCGLGFLLLYLAFFLFTMIRTGAFR
jgi:hypothetical protein